MIAKPPQPVADFQCGCDQGILRAGRGVEIAEQQSLAEPE